MIHTYFSHFPPFTKTTLALFAITVAIGLGLTVAVYRSIFEINNKLLPDQRKRYFWNHDSNSTIRHLHRHMYPQSNMHRWILALEIAYCVTLGLCLLSFIGFR